MPFLGIGETDFDPEFEMARLGDLQSRLGEITFSQKRDVSTIQ